MCRVYKMAPKALLVMAVLVAALLLISSEVTATETAKTAKEVQTKGAVEDQQCKRCRPCCFFSPTGCCLSCCRAQPPTPSSVVME